MLQWVCPCFILEKEHIHQRKVNESFQSLRKIVKAHTYEIEKVYIWIHINPLMTKRDQLQLETSLEQQMTNFLQKKTEVFFITESQNSPLDKLISQVDKLMHLLCIYEPFHKIVLVSGLNENLLQQAVLIEGIKTFDDQFCLYIKDEHTEQSIVQQFEESPYRKSWLKLIRHFIHDFDYIGALELLNGLIENDTVQHIKLLLEVQNARLNFSFQEAQEKIQQAKRLKENHLHLMQTELILRNLVGENGKQQQELEQIHELYRHMKIMLLKEDFPSFLTRFYRTREALLYYIVNYGCSEKIDLPRTSSIYQLIEKVEDLYEEGKIIRFYGAYFYLKSSNVADTLAVRNKSFIGHHRKPIHKSTIFEEYYGAKPFKNSQATDRFLGDTRIMLRDLGVTMDSNLENMNEYILTTLQNATREGEIKID